MFCGVQRKSEAQIIAEKLGGYDYKSSDVWKKLMVRFSSGIRHHELFSVAIIIQQIIKSTSLSRNEKRSFPLLIRWFERNWNSIESVLSSIRLLDVNFHSIDAASEKQTKQFYSFIH